MSIKANCVSCARTCALPTSYFQDLSSIKSFTYQHSRKILRRSAENNEYGFCLLAVSSKAEGMENSSNYIFDAHHSKSAAAYYTDQGSINYAYIHRYMHAILLNNLKTGASWDLGFRGGGQF